MDTGSTMTEEELVQWSRDHGTPPHLKLFAEGTIDGHRIRISCEVAEALHDRAEIWVRHQIRRNSLEDRIEEEQVYEPGEEWH